MRKISQIQTLVRYGLYYLTDYADYEAMEDMFTIYDVECGIMSGRIRRTWPKDEKYEVIGRALDGRTIGMVCRFTTGGKVRIITVYEDTYE